MLAALLLSPTAGAQEVPVGASGVFGANVQQQGSLSGGCATPSPGQRIDVLRFVDPQPRPTTPGAQLGGAAETTAPGVTQTAAPTDFQNFVVASVGRLLPIFGESLFVAPPSTFSPLEGLAPTADYLIGPGDEFLIRGWGQVEIDVMAVATREGTISIPRVDVVSVAGTRHQDLHGAIRTAVGRPYKNFDVAVSLGRLRSIQVFVVGQAARPGLYTVGSLSTLLNSPFSSVLRAGGSVFSRRHVGLFGSSDGEVLMPNDAIVVPTDYNPTNWVRELKDWSQIFFNFGLGVAALKVLLP